MDKKAKPNSQKAKTNKKDRKVYKWLRCLVIFILIIISLSLLNTFREKIQVTLHFGDQPIMDTKLLGLKLKRQSFTFSNSSNSFMGKPSRSSMVNCFYKPDNIHNIDIIERVMTYAEELDWEFNREFLWIEDNGNISIMSEDKNGFSLWVRVTQPSENIKMSKTEICVSIGDTETR